MEEDIQLIKDSVKEDMNKAILHLEKALLKIRAGRANPAMLDGVRVDYYGAMTPLAQVANINTPDARTLLVQPWEKKLIPDIERAIINGNLGFNPMNNGEAIIINIPPLTEERRKSLVKMAREEGEEAKVSIRAGRKEGMDETKRLEKDGLAEDMGKDLEKQIQDLTNSYVAKVENLITEKEAEIMTV
jgi:ribosome recycling factor